MNVESKSKSEEVPCLRGATLVDGPFVLWLEDVCMREYAIALWGAWRPSTTLEEIDLSGHQIIELEGQAVGCVATTRFEDYLRVDKLYLSPDHRSRGIGADILKKVIDNAGLFGLTVKLDVLTTNPALKFYLREGFSIENETAERRTLVKASGSTAHPATGS